MHFDQGRQGNLTDLVSDYCFFFLRLFRIRFHLGDDLGSFLKALPQMLVLRCKLADQLLFSLQKVFDRCFFLILYGGL